MILLIYLIIINIISFLMCGIDKRRAIKHKNRISEKTLLTFCMFGGCFLFFIGMHLFHHKTKKAKFYILEPLFIIMYSIFIYIILIN